MKKYALGPFSWKRSHIVRIKSNILAFKLVGLLHKMIDGRVHLFIYVFINTNDSKVLTNSVSHAIKEEPPVISSREAHIMTCFNADHREKIKLHVCRFCNAQDCGL